MLVREGLFSCQNRCFFFMPQFIRGDPEQWGNRKASKLSKLTNYPLKIKLVDDPQYGNVYQIWSKDKDVLIMDRCSGCFDVSDLIKSINYLSDFGIDRLLYRNGNLYVKKDNNILVINYPVLLQHSINRPYLIDMYHEIDIWIRGLS